VMLVGQIEKSVVIVEMLVEAIETLAIKEMPVHVASIQPLFNPDCGRPDVAVLGLACCHWLEQNWEFCLVG
jgi:hypothetical protein